MSALTVSVAETARILSMGRTTIYKLINEGRLESVSIGRRRLIKTASIQQLLEDAA